MELFDSDDCRTIAMELEKLASAGCGVVVGISADKGDFVSAFENATVFEGADLTFNLTEARKRDAFFSEMPSYSFQFRTRGLIGLACALCDDRSYEKVGPVYEQEIDLLALNVLEDCTDRMIRKAIVASVLVSHGSFSMLKSMGIRMSSKTVEYMDACVPWLGFKASEGAFRFAGGECLPPLFLDLALKQYPGVCRRAVACLIKRGSVARAAEIVRAMRRKRMDVESFMPYAVEFYDAGAEDVAITLASCGTGEKGVLAGKIQTQALAYLRGESDTPARADKNELLQAGKSERRRMSLLDARAELLGRPGSDERGWSSISVLVGNARNCTNVFDSKLARHLEAVNALIVDDPRRAVSLYGRERLRDDAGLIDLLRYAGYTVAIRMAGDGWTSDYECQRQLVVDRLENAGFTSQARRVNLLFDLADELFGEEFEPSNVDTICRRVQPGDGTLVAMLAELAGAAADMERGRYLDAFTRSEKLLSGAGGRPPASVAAAAHAIACLSGACCSERPGPLEADGTEFSRGVELHVLDVALWKLFCEEGDIEKKLADGALKSMLASIEPTPSVMFVVRAAMRCKARVADAFETIVPPSWRHIWPSSFTRTDAAPAVDALEPERNTGTAPFLYIEAMGGLRVYKNGTLIPDRVWKRSSAQALILYLALARNHSARRVDIGRCLWPEVDYYRMRDNMYSCLSAVRKALGESAGSPKCLATSIGRIMLDPDYVQVDKDRFEVLAKQVVRRERGDQWTLHAGERILDLYRGGMAMPPSDPDGIFAAEKDRIDVFFADAMVECARAATRVGLYKEAVRFAREAVDVVPDREDAARVFMVALTRDGRGAEAKRAYETFSGRIFELTGRAPSFDLPSVLEESPDNREYAS
jgi:DNA-binding SARP family transcriptional activator